MRTWVSRNPAKIKCLFEVVAHGALNQKTPFVTVKLNTQQFQVICNKNYLRIILRN